MTRCCVPGCDSGTFKEVKKTRIAGLRVKSFFMFPKNDDLYKKWKEIIFQNNEEIIDKPKICELHFNESDIIKYYETVLKDGTIHRIKRQRYLLRNGAIPVIANDQDFNKNSLIQIQKNTSSNSNGESNDQQTFENNLNQNVNNYNIGRSIYISNSSINDNKRQINQSKETIFTDDIQIINVTKVKKYYRVPNNQDKYENYIRKETDDIQDKNIRNLQIHNDMLCQNIMYNKENSDIKLKKIENYSFSQLKNDLQKKILNISSSWSFAFQGNASMTFAYVHPLKFTIQLFCIIDSNMNAKIATFDRKICTNSNIKFNSSGDFVNYLCKLEKTKCCDGTGIKNIYSKKCQGFISSLEEYKRSRGYQRCNSCRIFRKIILRKEDNPVDAESQIREQNRKIKALQFKCIRLQKLLFEKQKTSEKLNI